MTLDLENCQIFEVVNIYPAGMMSQSAVQPYLFQTGIINLLILE